MKCLFIQLSYDVYILIKKIEPYGWFCDPGSDLACFSELGVRARNIARSQRTPLPLSGMRIVKNEELG